MGGVATWDALKILLSALADDEARPLRSYPMPSVDEGRQPPFHIGLAPWALDVAGQLETRFGDDVVLTVGALHFPSRSLRNWDGSARPAPLTSDERLLDPAVAEVALTGDLEVRSGLEARGELRLVNRGAAELALWTNGQVIGRVVEPETREAIGGFSGAMKLPAVAFRVAPDCSVAAPLFVGTDSFRVALGYAVPPGRWAVEVVLDLRHDGKWRSPLLPIMVVE